MTCQQPAPVVRGMDVLNSQDRDDSIEHRRGHDDGAKPANRLERLIQIMRSNERLMADLAASRERIDRARAYLDAPGSNARFGSAHLDRCRGKHSAILAGLRANRIEALDLLARTGSEA